MCGPGACRDARDIRLHIRSNKAALAVAAASDGSGSGSGGGGGGARIRGGLCGLGRVRGGKQGRGWGGARWGVEGRQEGLGTGPRRDEGGEGEGV